MLCVTFMTHEWDSGFRDAISDAIRSGLRPGTPIHHRRLDWKVYASEFPAPQVEDVSEWNGVVETDHRSISKTLSATLPKYFRSGRRSNRINVV